MDKLSQMISYISPVVSFTTYPGYANSSSKLNLDISPKDELILKPESLFSAVLLWTLQNTKEDWKIIRVLDGQIEYKILLAGITK